MRISDWSSDVCSSDLPTDGYCNAYRFRLQSFFASLGALGVLARALIRRPFLGVPVNPIVRWFHQLGSPPYFDGFARRYAPWAYGARSEERRVGKECVSTCRSGWSPDY